MKAKKYWILVGMLAILSAHFFSAGSFAELKNDQQSLVEIKALCVFVQGLTEEAKKAGLSGEQIQTDVEQKLKRNGVKIVSQEECLEIPGNPVFYVNISANKSKQMPAFFYHIDVGLLQKVTLVREPEIRIVAITWNKGALVYCHKREFSASVRKTVRHLVDVFINDYLAANPEKQKKTMKDEQMITGTVRYVGLEGGFYGLVADDGRKYDPVDLPDRYKKNGLRVKFRVKEKKGTMGIHMWGKIVEVVKIEEM